MILRLRCCVQVHSQSTARREAGPTLNAGGHKVTAPDKDTTVVPLPHSHHHESSSDIGPIWTERDSSGHGAKQASLSHSHTATIEMWYITIHIVGVLAVWTLLLHTEKNELQVKGVTYPTP